MDEPWFTARLEDALALRQSAFDKPYYRLVYGDSDTLPGLIIDRFGDVLVAQLNNSGLERYREPLLAALRTTLQPAGVLLRADSRARREQGLATDSEVAFGDVPREVPLAHRAVHDQGADLTLNQLGMVGMELARLQAALQHADQEPAARHDDFAEVEARQIGKAVRDLRVDQPNDRYHVAAADKLPQAADESFGGLSDGGTGWEELVD